MPASTPEEGVESLAKACHDLNVSLGLADNFKSYGISEEEYMSKLDRIAVLAYEDQCSPCNPRVPLVEDMKEILRKAYTGEQD